MVNESTRELKKDPKLGSGLLALRPKYVDSSSSTQQSSQLYVHLPQEVIKMKINMQQVLFIEHKETLLDAYIQTST